MNDLYKTAVLCLIGAHGAPYDVYVTAICRVRRAHQSFTPEIEQIHREGSRRNTRNTREKV